ncbi:hypothetical protein JQ628_08300 [Bradyrhizobium lablabi]|uniref:hypothetical protein n=1 Tax=Bradyrhizobium lablabi TaxID=722472 RepID=UPI001BA8175B|nr:hypothetical protein [Bradyrhizobium lablabi]MBR1121508.1 hypothetical protein [Bradyrhizobium lablabi]
METPEKYLQRKKQEIELLNACLNTPLSLQAPSCPADAIKQKFKIASALKAEFALEDWALTETAWAHHGRMRAGPFEFSYDYQRADLEVRGPSFYAFANPVLNDTIYTSSGMSAISALLLSSKNAIPSAEILLLPGSYGETIEFVESYCRHLQPVHITLPAKQLVRPAGGPRILLLDSCSTAEAFESVLRLAPKLDLVVFDTTCFSSGSRRIGRVLNWARRREFPMVLVRSHTKLDSLGLEYGRLGSAVFVDAKCPAVDRNRDLLSALSGEMRKAIRLLGGAPLPAHFPPYVGSATYRVLTDRRVASMLRNSRRTSRYFADVLGPASHAHFAHALYLTLEPDKPVDEGRAREMAEDLSRDLGKMGFLIRHAGSFGFDFGATEWFHDSITDRYLVRIAVPDMPGALWDEVARAIARWWSRRGGRSSRHGPAEQSQRATRGFR